MRSKVNSSRQVKKIKELWYDKRTNREDWDTTV